MVTLRYFNKFDATITICSKAITAVMKYSSSILNWNLESAQLNAFVIPVMWGIRSKKLVNGFFSRLQIWYCYWTLRMCAVQLHHSLISPFANLGTKAIAFRNTRLLEMNLVPITSSSHAKEACGLGSGCGSVGRAVASKTRGPRLKSSHGQNFIYILNICYCQLCIEKMKIKKKMPGMAHF